MKQTSTRQKQNKTKSTIRTILPAALVGACIGVGISITTDEFTMFDREGSVFLFIGLLLAALFISIAIHEFAHAIALIRDGIPMRAIFIGPFSIMKHRTGWKVRWKLRFFLGGIAIPDLPCIKDEADFLLHKRAYERAIIAAPIVTIVVGVISLAIGTIAILLMDHALGSPIVMTAISFTLVAILLTVSSFHQSDLVLGDFPAYKRLKQDPFLAAVILYQYVGFSTNYDTKRRQNTYLKQRLIRELDQKFHDKTLDLYTVSILTTMIHESMIGISDNIPQPVQAYADYFVQHHQLLIPSSRHEPYLILAIHVVYLLHMQQRGEEALQLYEQLKTKLPNNDVFRYYMKKAEQLLGLSDHTQFLSDRRNMKLSSLHTLWSQFDTYYDDELLLNEKLLAIKPEAVGASN